MPEQEDRSDPDSPRSGRRAPGDEESRPAVGTSGTGRSVLRNRAEAATTRVPARAADGTRTAAVRTRRPPADAPEKASPRRAADDGSAPDRPSRDRNGRGTGTRDRTSAEDARRGPAPGTGASDDAERAGEGRLRADRIDETLTRLTAAHAGLVLADHGRDDSDAELDEDDGADPAPRPRAAVRVGRIAVAAVALLLVLVAGLGWVGRTRLDGALNRVAAVDVPPDGVLDAAAQTGDENVLLLATDPGGSDGATTRANTAVVVHRDVQGDRTVAVTLPPDLEITRPPCERWDAAAATYLGQTVPAEPRTTFDTAYAVGGPRCATRAAQQVTGLTITRFAAVDLAATSAMVEAVGGVEVCVERPVLDAVLGPVVPAAGPGPLNGARAGDLVRAADVRDDPAPATGLVQRQQRVLAGALAQALSPERLLHPGRVGRLMPALSTAVVSTGTGVADLLALARRLAGADVTLVGAPTEPAANSRGNRVLRESDAAALFAAVRSDGPLPALDPAVGDTAVAPADVTADVLNASGRDGLAAEVAGTLGELGFRTAEVTNAEQPALDTVVRFSPDRAEQAQLLAATVPSASVVPDPGTSGVLQLVLGRSFDGTVRAAATPSDDDAAASAAAAAPAATCS
jgi:LCP family protein required for cell wall assembly